MHLCSCIIVLVVATCVVQSQKSEPIASASPVDGPRPTGPPVGEFRRAKKQYKDCHADPKAKPDARSRGCESIYRGIKAMLTPAGSKPVSPGSHGSAVDKSACEVFTKKAESVFTGVTPTLDFTTLCCDQFCFCKEVAEPSTPPCGGYYERPKSNDRKNGGRGQRTEKGSGSSSSAASQTSSTDTKPSNGGHSGVSGSGSSSSSNTTSSSSNKQSAASSQGKE